MRNYFVFFSFSVLFVFGYLNAQVKIGDNPKQIHPSALLELESIDRGFLLPRLTTAQRDIAFKASIPEGLLIFNTDNQCIEAWITDSGSWHCIGNDKQQISLSGHQLKITDGGTVDLTDYINTDEQKLSLNGNTLSLSNGGHVDLSAIDIEDSDQQTIDNFSFNDLTNTLTVGITNGNSRSVDLSPLSGAGSDSQSIAELRFDDVADQLTVGITNGSSMTVDLSHLDDTGTDSQSIAALRFDSDNNDLTVGISGGASATVNLSDLANTFVANGNLIYSAVGTTTHNFVFGSDQLGRKYGTDDDHRFYFNKTKGAFRAGRAGDTAWDDVNVGEVSIALGFNPKAKSKRGIAIGNSVQTNSYAEVVVGSYNDPITSPVPSLTTWNSDDPIFVVGNGTSNAAKSNALVVLKNGDTTLDGNLKITAGHRYYVGTQSLTVPDYVFENYFDGFSSTRPDYRMRSLQEIETFVRNLRHLPGVQSHREAQQAGKWDLTENVRVNLEKIEELYLHTIEQQKQIEHLSHQLKIHAALLFKLIEKPD